MTIANVSPPQGPPVYLFRFCVAASGSIQPRQVDERGGERVMLRSLCLLLDCRGTLEERFCFRIASLFVIQRRQVVECGGEFGMLWTQRGLCYRQGTLVERFRIGVSGSRGVKRPCRPQAKLPGRAGGGTGDRGRPLSTLARQLRSGGDGSRTKRS